MNSLPDDIMSESSFIAKATAESIINSSNFVPETSTNGFVQDSFVGDVDKVATNDVVIDDATLRAEPLVSKGGDASANNKVNDCTPSYSNFDNNHDDFEGASLKTDPSTATPVGYAPPPPLSNASIHSFPPVHSHSFPPLPPQAAHPPLPPLSSSSNSPPPTYFPYSPPQQIHDVNGTPLHHSPGPSPYAAPSRPPPQVPCPPPLPSHPNPSPSNLDGLSSDPSSKPAKRRRPRNPLDVQQKKLIKNQKSRLRAQQLRETIQSIQTKPPFQATREEASLIETFEERRQRKNVRSRERAAEKKREAKRILEKKEEERTEEEKETLKVFMDAKKRKNEGDRLRRERKKLGGQKGVNVSAAVVGPSVGGGASVDANSPSGAALGMGHGPPPLPTCVIDTAPPPPLSVPEGNPDHRLQLETYQECATSPPPTATATASMTTTPVAGISSPLLHSPTDASFPYRGYSEDELNLDEVEQFVLSGMEQGVEGLIVEGNDATSDTNI